MKGNSFDILKGERQPSFLPIPSPKPSRDKKIKPLRRRCQVAMKETPERNL
jgi:hypothetical protein